MDIRVEDGFGMNLKSCRDWLCSIYPNAFRKSLNPFLLFLTKGTIEDWLFVWVLWHINPCMLFNAKSIFTETNTSISNNSVKHKYRVKLSKTFLFQAIQFNEMVLIKTIQFNISIVIFFYTQLNVKTVLLQTIQFSINTKFRYQNSYISTDSI